MSNITNWTDGEKFLASIEPIFADLIIKYGSCTLQPIAKEQYYLTLIKGILSQQVSSEVSQKFFQAFTNIFGQNPEPEQLLNASIEKITTCGCNEQKAQYIKDLSKNILENKITLDSFSEMDDSAIIKQLTEVKGFGRWTAEIFLILALNRPNVLPADDFGLKKAMQLLFELPSIPQKRSQVSKIADNWSPWRSLATWYLWQYFAEL